MGDTPIDVFMDMVSMVLPAERPSDINPFPLAQV